MNSRRAGVVAIFFVIVLFFILFFSKYLPQGEMTNGAVTLKHHREGTMHRYTAQISLAHPCDSVGSVISTDPNNLAAAKIALMTQRLPGVSCTPQTTPHTFSFSLQNQLDPAHTSLTLDGKELPVAVVEE